MTPKEFILMCMSAEGKIAEFSPVQIQKMIFISQDKTQPEDKIFNFYPYDYGPFDPDIYIKLSEMEKEELISIKGDKSSKRRFYYLTNTGFNEGQNILKHLSPDQQDYLKRLSEWIRGVSFAELVGAVYKAYPEFSEKSIFKEN